LENPTVLDHEAESIQNRYLLRCGAFQPPSGFLRADKPEEGVKFQRLLVRLRWVPAALVLLFYQGFFS